MLESVFFITLGISCVLLMMLIYHFKQRISKLESNNETMFEIINNMVQELSAIKTNFQSQVMQSQVMQSQFSYPSNQYDKINVDIGEDNNMTILKQSGTIEEYNTDVESEDESEDESDDESDAESDDESDDESDNESEQEGSDDKVKLISIDVANIDESVDVESLSEENEESSEMVEINDIDNIQVNKIDNNEHLEETEDTDSMINKKEVYKRMNVTSLKALVVEKGLHSDPHKMKKAELIDLLENN